MAKSKLGNCTWAEDRDDPIWLFIDNNPRVLESVLQALRPVQVASFKLQRHVLKDRIRVLAWFYSGQSLRRLLREMRQHCKIERESEATWWKATVEHYMEKIREGA